MAHRNLAGSRILVTGASAGIGLHLAGQLAAAGAHVVALARREQKLRELVEAALAAGSPGTVDILAGDVTDPETRRRAVRLAVDRFGGLDGLINNAGIGSFGRFEEAEPERLRQIFEVNFFSVVELTRLAIPELLKGNRPIIVNVSSILGHRGIPRMHEYCATKFALRGWSESLRIELKPQGIDLLLVSPGTTETDFYDNVVHGRGQVPWPKGRGVSGEKVASATLRAMQRGKREIIPNFAGRMLVWASSRAPAIVDRFMVRYA